MGGGGVFWDKDNMRQRLFLHMTLLKEGVVGCGVHLNLSMSSFKYMSKFCSSILFPYPEVMYPRVVVCR